MTNFDFLLSDPQFTPFGEVAVAAEKIYTIDPAACVLNCRRAMEFAIKWDVFRGRRVGYALRRPAGQPHGHRRF